MTTLLAMTLAGCRALDPDFGDLQPGAEKTDGGGEGVVFARDIRPLMDRSDTDPSGHGCKHCHYSTQARHTGIDLGSLDLATLGSLRVGGTTSGPDIVVAGDPDKSALVQKIEGTYFFGARMPKSGPPFWSQPEIQIVRDWIAQGAKGADDE